MKPVTRITPSFAGVCAIIACLSACGRSDTTEKPEPKAALTVELINPRTSIWPVELAASGRVEPWQECVISSEVGDAKLDEVLVDVGDTVKRGQLLARFNDEGARAKLEEMEAGVRSGEATLATSRDQWERSRRLVTSRAVSEESHRQNETTVQKDEAELSSARARVSAQQLELRHTRVLAPDDGVISSRSATVGTVPASGSELFRLIRQNRLEWRAEIPAKHLPGVTIGQAATLTSGNGRTIHGTVRQPGPTIDPRTLNALCYIDLPHPGPAKAGMFLSGVIRIGESPAVHVPESAIVYRDGYSHVIKVGPEATASQIKVGTGRRMADLVEIHGDITGSDRVVLSGGSFVNEGDVVKIISPGEKTGIEGGGR